MRRLAKWKTALLLLALAAVLLEFMLRQFEHSQIYHPARDFRATAAELGRPFEDVFFQSEDGVKLNGWYFQGNSNGPGAGWAVLLCHGNGGNIGDRVHLYEALLSTGLSVFAFDYRGYGRSEGRPSEEGTYRDARAAYLWLTKKGFPGTSVVVYGESLGGGIASELAAGEPVAGLVLQSTFTSIPDVGADLYPWLPVRWMARIHYDTRSRLPRIHCPVLVMHSRDDGLIPFRHGERNFAAANEPKLFWELAGQHNEAVGDRAHFIAGMEKFLALARRATASVPSNQASGSPGR